MQAPTGSTSRSILSTATLVRGPTEREGGLASRATATIRTEPSCISGTSFSNRYTTNPALDLLTKSYGPRLGTSLTSLRKTLKVAFAR